LTYIPAEGRYQGMPYNRCGRSGLKLPALSLGLYQNFGASVPFASARTMVLRAFDLGITHLDLANNYGLPPGSAEAALGRLLETDLAAHRDELIISTKAGWTMWPGPYGDLGSRKYLLASLDQSLARLGLDYVDIFYSHRLDPETPLEETMGALDQAVRQGKALYAGISSYPPAETRAAAAILERLGTPCLIHQPAYSLLNRSVEDGLLDVLDEEGIGCIAFSVLAQGALSGKYRQGVPADSRAADPANPFRRDYLGAEVQARIGRLGEIAGARGQTLAQMALAWVLRDRRVTSALIGASRVEQIDDAVGALSKPGFGADELATIERALA
jgi:L-glyceraldehyde 3-phosphate reductase